MNKQWLKFNKWGPWAGGALATWAVERLFDLTASGLNGIWGWLLTVLSFGSSRVRDSVYAEASMNPDSVLVPMIAVLVSAAVVILVVELARIKRLLHQSAAKPPEADLGVSRQRSMPVWLLRIDKGVARLSYFLVPLLGFTLCLTLLFFTLIVQQAIVARRMYEVDKEIISPFVDTRRLLVIQSQFAQVRTKSEYIAVIKELSDVAKANGVTLREEASSFLN